MNAKVDFLLSDSPDEEKAIVLKSIPLYRAPEFFYQLNSDSICKTDTLDICGTGGAQTFNVSTAAAILLAAQGVKVSKHCGSSITSQSGSLDVIKALGIHTASSLEEAHSNLEEFNLSFLSAPTAHPILSATRGARKIVGFSVLNLVAPLLNPICPKNRFIGCNSEENARIIQNCLQGSPKCNYTIVVGDIGGKKIDEVSPNGDNFILSKYTERHFTLVGDVNPDDLLSLPPDESAAVINEMFLTPKEINAKKYAVVATAALALMLFNPELDFSQARRKLYETLDSGKAGELLEKLQNYEKSSSILGRSIA